jgi:hypothetical protein
MDFHNYDGILYTVQVPDTPKVPHHVSVSRTHKHIRFFHGFLSTRQKITYHSPTHRTLTLDKICILDNLDIPHIPGVKKFTVGTTEDEFLIRVDGANLVVQEKRNSTAACRWVETHPSHMEETHWMSAVQRLVRNQLQTTVLVPLQEATNHSSLYQQIKQFASMVPKFTTSERLKYNGILNIPNAAERLVDTNSPLVSLMRTVASTDLYTILHFVSHILAQFVNTPLRPVGTDRVQPVATAYNLLDAVCFYCGFIMPTLHSATIVIDDLRLPGLDGNMMFKLQKDNPGIFRVWYTADTTSTTHPCRIYRVQEYTKDGNRLVDADHTNTVVLDRVFRCYAMLQTHVIHTQAHQANIVAAQLSHTHLAIGDPLRKLIDVCTSNVYFAETVVGENLFFNSAPRADSFSPFTWLPKDVYAKFAKQSNFEMTYPVFDDVPIKVMNMSYNSIQHRKRIPTTSLIFGFSPVMNARRKFNATIHATCRKLSSLSLAYRGRQRAVDAYNTNKVPCIRSMPVRDGFDILENVIMMVLQHHYTHSLHMHDTSQTSSLLWNAAKIKDAHVFGPSLNNEPATQRPMQFGKNFPAALHASPVLRKEVERMIVELDRLECDSERSGVRIFRDLTSSIAL